MAVEQKSWQRGDQRCGQASPNLHTGLAGKLQPCPLSPVGAGHPRASPCLDHPTPPPRKQSPAPSGMGWDAAKPWGPRRAGPGEWGAPEEVLGDTQLLLPYSLPLPSRPPKAGSLVLRLSFRELGCPSPLP